MSRRRGRLVWGKRRREVGAVPRRCGLRPGEHGLGRRPAPSHGLGDALALERVDQAGGVAHEEHPAAGGRGADHAQLEPSAEAISH